MLRASGVVRVDRVPLARGVVAGYTEIYPGTVFPASVVALRDGRVWGASGAVLTADGRLLDEYSVELGRMHDHSIEYAWRRGPVERTDKLTSVLCTSGGGNYFHWMTDVLPRVHLLRRAGLDLREVELFVVNPMRSAFQGETLVRFGIRRERLRETHARFHLQPERMVTASAPGIPGDVPGWVCEFLRESFGAEASGGGRRIYVSRAGARGRRVRNEGEVLAALPGFACVRLETMTVREQAGLFAAAECVVAPHGAGLTNLVFCRPGTRVVELFSHGYGNACYANLARHVGLEYAAVGRRSGGELVREDTTVDVAALRRLL